MFWSGPVRAKSGRNPGARAADAHSRYNTWLHKYIAFIIAGGFGGLAGVLWAHLSGNVSPQVVILATSVDALLMVVLGDRARSWAGPSAPVWSSFCGLSQHGRPVVAVCAGWGICADDSLSPGGLMGIPERIRHRRALSGNPEETKKRESAS